MQEYDYQIGHSLYMGNNGFLYIIRDVKEENGVKSALVIHMQDMAHSEPETVGRWLSVDLLPLPSSRISDENLRKGGWIN